MRPAARCREHELANVGFRVGEIQWLLFGCELELFKAHSRPTAASGDYWKRTFVARPENREAAVGSAQTMFAPETSGSGCTAAIDAHWMCFGKPAYSGLTSNRQKHPPRSGVRIRAAGLNHKAVVFCAQWHNKQRCCLTSPAGG